MMNWQDRIGFDPGILGGKPVVKGTRLAVEKIVELMATGWSEQQIIENYPGLTHDDISACLFYATEILKSLGISRVSPAIVRTANAIGRRRSPTLGVELTRCPSTARGRWAPVNRASPAGSRAERRIAWRASPDRRPTTAAVRPPSCAHHRSGA